MWYQESLRQFLIPERIEDAHPLLQPGFRAMAERFAKVTWEEPGGARRSPSARPTRWPAHIEQHARAWAWARCCAG